MTLPAAIEGLFESPDDGLKAQIHGVVKSVTSASKLKQDGAITPLVRVVLEVESPPPEQVAQLLCLQREGTCLVTVVPEQALLAFPKSA